MRALIKLIKYYPILVNIYILIIMLTYVSGMRFNNCPHDVMLGNRKH